MRNTTIAWGTKRTSGLTYRMGARVAIAFNRLDLLKSQMGLSQTRLMWAARGTQSGNVNKWIMEFDFKGYNDNWSDWTEQEVAVLAERIKAEVYPDILRAVFKPPPEIMNRARGIAHGFIDHASEGESRTFTATDIPDPELRELANKRLREYDVKLDLSRPVTDANVRSLIITEIHMRKLEREMMGADGKDLPKLQDVYSDLRQRFSKSAEDVALLERQREIKPEFESIDAIVERADDIRPNWRDQSVDNMLERTHLIDLMAQLHRVAIEGTRHEPAQRVTKVTKPKPQADIFAERLLKSDEESGIVVISNQ